MNVLICLIKMYLLLFGCRCRQMFDLTDFEREKKHSLKRSFCSSDITIISIGEREGGRGERGGGGNFELLLS